MPVYDTIKDAIIDVANPSKDTQGSILGGPITSEYMGYGSFSGADIKVIVHYPRMINTGVLLRQEVEKLAADISKAQQELSNLIGDGSEPIAAADVAAVIEKQQEVDGLIKRLDQLEVDGEKSINLPTSKVLAEAQSVSWSIFREKTPVRTLGSVYPRAFTRGPRTIGGTFVFTIFHQHVLQEILDLDIGYYSTGVPDYDRYTYTTNLIDQLPPLDISFIFANEYGAISHMGIWGVEFLQEGATFSIEDIFSESVVQYVARDLDPMRLVNQRTINHTGVTKQWTKTAAELSKEKAFLNSHIIRRNPFI